jgi:hypothetical protein
MSVVFGLGHDNDNVLLPPLPVITDNVILAMNNYVQYKIPPGGFLEAVIKGDDVLARALADPHNIANYQSVKDYVSERLHEAGMGMGMGM